MDSIPQLYQQILNRETDSFVRVSEEQYKEMVAKLAGRGMVRSGIHISQAMEIESDNMSFFIKQAISEFRRLLYSGEVDFEDLAKIYNGSVDRLFRLAVERMKDVRNRIGGPVANDYIEGDLESVRSDAFQQLDILKSEWQLNLVGGVVNVKQPPEVEQKFKILYSEAQAEKDFTEWLSDAAQSEYRLATLFLDIDYFKRLNTKYTETVVDETILPEVQNLLKHLTSHHGRAYRHGGEEFLVILRNYESDEAVSFAEKLRRTFEAHTFDIRGNKEKLTISIGIALWPEHGRNLR
jgi:diguanylate cyclase (GGDEF)-like protein